MGHAVEPSARALPEICPGGARDTRVALDHMGQCACSDMDRMMQLLQVDASCPCTSYNCYCTKVVVSTAVTSYSMLALVVEGRDVVMRVCTHVPVRSCE